MKLTNSQKLITEELNESADIKKATAKLLYSEIKEVCKLIIMSVKKGGKILLIGNGGSAADAQHIAADFVGKFRYEVSIPALALTTDTSILTALSNDYDFKLVFSKQIESLGNKNDILIAISTSGSSKNILEALKSAKKNKITTIALTGQNKTDIQKYTQICLKIPSKDVARIQETHICIGHIICHIVKKYFHYA